MNPRPADYKSAALPLCYTGIAHLSPEPHNREVGSVERSHTPALIGQLRGDANLIGWWAFRDLNPEPSAYEADALTVVLKAHKPEDG